MKKLFSFGLPIIGILVFSFTATVISDSQQRNILGDLLEARTTLLESAYTGEVTFEQVEAALPEYVANPLLEQDLDTLLTWQDTEYDRVIDFHINWCKKVSENDHGIVLRAKITWDMYDLEGEYTVWEEYLFVIEKGEVQAYSGEVDYKLSEMKVRSRPYT